MHREEALCVPNRLEPPHGALPLAGRLVGVFRPVVQIPVLPMFHARQDLAQGRPIAFQLIRNDHPRYIGPSLQELADESFRRVLVPPEERC